jgi:uncharacterized protein YqeY
MLEQKIEQDLKAALLSHQSVTVTTLRGLKSVLLDYKVSSGTRGEPVPDEEVIRLFAKEAKKRQESADLYVQGGDSVRAEAELTEKALIQGYLPEKLSEAELVVIIDQVITEFDSPDKSAMGKVIADVKVRTQGAADGAMIAALVKNKLAA